MALPMGYTKIDQDQATNGINYQSKCGWPSGSLEIWWITLINSPALLVNFVRYVLLLHGT